MTNQISTQVISFHGSELITLKVDDVIYTAVRPIVEALGLSWGSQQRKLENSKEKFSCTHMKTTGNDGKTYEMLCMPLKKLNGWLFSINPEKVRADLREKVIQYQEECFEALYNYWHFGKAERKTTVDQRTGLRNAVNMLVSKKGLIYSDAYHLIHQRFNVESIKDLTLEQLPQAVEYVHKIILEGELITDPELPSSEKKFSFEFTEYELQTVAWACFAFRRNNNLLHELYSPLAAIGSKFAVEARDNAVEYRNTLRRFNEVVKRITADIEADPETNWRVLKHIRSFNEKIFGKVETTI